MRTALLCAMITPLVAWSSCEPPPPGGADGGLDAGGSDAHVDAGVDASGPGLDASVDSGPGSDDRPGCGSSVLRQVSDDTSERGPWPVGVRTLSVPLPGGLLGKQKSITVEIWYPAVPGSEAGVPPVAYDLRDFLPAGEGAKIPDAEATSDSLICDCQRDLPIDAMHGPYPLAVYIHGTASFRVASGHTMTHWASRGFVVIAADHPGMDLADMLALASLGSCSGSGIRQNVGRDLDAMLAAVTDAQDAFAFLAGHVDVTRVGLVGHSQGAAHAANFTDRPGVRLCMPLAGYQPVDPTPILESVFVLDGMADAVVGWDAQLTTYDGSPSPKRIVGIAGAGHLAVTDLCGGKNAEGLDAVQVATKYDVCGIYSAGALWDCDPSYIPQARQTAIVNYTTAAALEETLQCANRDDAFSQLLSRYSDVGYFQEDLSH